MGRPKKVEDSRSRSFLLPGGLLEQLTAAAEMRGKDVSDVVRDILEGHIRPYLQESRRVRLRRLGEAVDAVRRDAALLPLFEKHRGRKNLVLPLAAGLKKNQLVLLMEALEADRELRGAAAPGEAGDPLLQEVASRVGGDAGGRLLALDELLNKGDIAAEKDGDVIRFGVSPRVSEMLRHKQRDDPAVEVLRTLIEDRVLQQDGSRGGSTLYRVSPQKLR